MKFPLFSFSLATEHLRHKPAKTMKLSSNTLIFTAATSTGRALAFSPPKSTFRHGRNVPPGALGMVSTYGSSTGGRVDVSDEYAPRDVYSMEEWATQYGVQKADGVQ